MSIARNPWVDFVLALCLTGIMAFVSWYLARGLPFIGIDDAAITRSYAENLANGAGYVYNVGGERVEGSTAFLWASMLTILYAITDTPELLIIALSGFLTVFSVFFLMRLTRLLCDLISIDHTATIAVLSLLLLALPGYFMWTIWTMMEVALWSMLLIALVLFLSRTLERPENPSTGVLVALALLLPLTRPEGIVFTLGLLVFALLLGPGRWRALLPAIVAAVVSFVAITAFRLAYFGQPFPNTFYAKVSSDRLQGIKDGLKYLIDFVLGLPFAELYLACIVAAVVWAVLNLRGRTPGHKSLLIVSAACVGALMAYAILGGDHFVLWRFYQPVMPLMVVPLAIGLVACLTPVLRDHRGVIVALAVAVPLFAILLSAMQYYQSRFSIRKEFVLVQQGLEFGEYLNAAEPLPSIGTGPAGGIALAYDGEILDLLGLNWTIMAHANPVKIGMRNHASFHKPTFWEHAPDVVSAFNRPCEPGEELSFWESDDDAFDGLYSDADFRELYSPVLFVDGQTCWPGFATSEWLSTAEVPGMTVLDWNNVRILN